MRMTKAAALVACTLTTGTAANAASYIQLIESDQNSTMFYWQFASLEDLVSGPNFDRDTSYGGDIGWGSNFSAGGLTYNGSQYIQAIESDVGSKVFYWVFDSLENLVSGPNFDRDKSYGGDIGWSSNYSLGGLAYNGSQYIQAIESDVGSTVFYWVFDSLEDLVSGPNFDRDTSYGGDIGWGANYSLAGLTWNGSQYIQTIESDDGSTVFYWAFDSFEDLVSGPNFDRDKSYGGNIGWGSNYSLAGLAYLPDPPDTPAAVPLPAGLWLFSGALAGLGLLRRKGIPLRAS